MRFFRLLVSSLETGGVDDYRITPKASFQTIRNFQNVFLRLEFIEREHSHSLWATPAGSAELLIYITLLFRRSHQMDIAILSSARRCCIYLFGSDSLLLVPEERDSGWTLQ